MVWGLEVERRKVGGDEKKRAEERTQVSNHLPGEKKVAMAIHQRDKANIDEANCLFSSSPHSFRTKCAIKVMRCC